MSETLSRRLHIGGVQRKRGWEILNAVAGPYVDHLSNGRILSQFENETFTELYASHVLEHFAFVEVPTVLREWGRVLKPSGRLFISVPDLSVLASLFLDLNLTIGQRFELMKIIYGGQVDEYDFHKCGFSEDLLWDALAHGGFSKARRVESFGLFDDTSESVFLGRRVSINVIAYK